MFKKIIVPVDPNEVEFAESALAAAAELARPSGAEIRLVAVMPTLNGYVAELLPADYSVALGRETDARIHAVAAKAGLAPTGYTLSLRTGSVYHEVIDEAVETGADVIVVTSHRPAMKTYLLGSNAAKIVRHAPCSVLVMRDPAPPAA
ncbi:universal stress protein [Siculibacillus lacustris]|uniref:Universal stress protein n=1 Tax=Siculibacillus lacustris TaxID=1549641 RepID=A0A4Q9VF79_9HYPH|nr:universal stress protein [Siculibacillus lacustris]TBW33514.1 universal stress protein [Siculibacillus lacustris]